MLLAPRLLRARPTRAPRLPADDPRVVASLDAIADELRIDGLVSRYSTDETDDGLEAKRGHPPSARSSS
jgi:GH15 family glucan-1,4-alpha-glucosidase